LVQFTIRAASQMWSYTYSEVSKCKAPSDSEASVERLPERPRGRSYRCAMAPAPAPASQSRAEQSRAEQSAIASTMRHFWVWRCLSRALAASHLHFPKPACAPGEIRVAAGPLIPSSCSCRLIRLLGLVLCIQMIGSGGEIRRGQRSQRLRGQWSAPMLCVRQQDPVAMSPCRRSRARLEHRFIVHSRVAASSSGGLPCLHVEGPASAFCSLQPAACSRPCPDQKPPTAAKPAGLLCFC